MERLTNLGGQITPCTCGKQPRALHRLGKNVHALECCPCQVRTAFHPTLQEALAEWEISRNPEHA